MTFREFLRFHLLKALLALIVIQLGIIAFVQNYDHRPKAQSDKVSVFDGHTVKISPLDNDSDKDKKDELSIKHVSSPKHGVSKQDGNLLYYTPNKGFTGTDSITYTNTDGKKESKMAYIIVQVKKNLPPITNNDSAYVYSGSSAIIDVLKNDRDREGDSIFVKKFTQPVHGQLRMSENDLVYSANNYSAQQDSFQYIACDGINNSKPATVHIIIKSKTDPCYPWLSSDIGNAAKPGSFTCHNKTYIIKASGSDIWNNSDGCHYAYQAINGDCEIYAKVESLQETNEWAKAGVMARESLNGDSKMAFVCVTAKNGVTYHWRSSTNGSAVGGDRYPNIKAPYWVKLIRQGNTFSFYVSPNGRSWKKMGSKDVPMKKDIYIGFAVTSHDNSKICKAVFSKYGLKSKTEKL